MKTKVLGAIMAVLCSLSVFSQQGTCADPIVVTLPFQTSNTTANFGNTYSEYQGTTTCGATPSGTNFFAGHDVFYSFTAENDGPVSLIMTPSAVSSSIFVYTSCPSSGSSCVAGMANTSSAVRNFSFVATAGQTYTIAISSSAITPTFSFDLLVQKQDCGIGAAPVSLNATATSLTSANLSWNDITGSSLWEVVVQPQGQTVPQPGAASDFTATPSFSKTGLTAGTNYQYWVRGLCASATFSGWAGPFSFWTPLCTQENKCNYKFRLTDSANNGWNGAAMQVKQNGQVVASTSGATTFGPTYISGAGPVDVTFALCDSQPFEVYWLTPGTQPQQCAFSILNSFGQTIFTNPAGMGSAGSTVYSGAVNCTSTVCEVVPSDLTTSAIYTTSATLNWTAVGTSSWDIYLVPMGNPMPTANTVPTYNDVTVNGFTVAGLAQSTTYSYYVRTNCASGPTAWSLPGTFTTVTSCYKPTLLSVSGVTQTATTVSWQKGTPTDTNWDILLIPGPGTPSTPGDNPSTANGSILVNTSAGSPYTFTNLQNATIYSYYIRTVCSALDKSAWAGPYTFYTVTCDDANKCNYKFILTDAGSNGWNGAKMQVRQNGIVIAALGTQITGAGPTTVSVPLCSNVPFDVYWSVAGTADSEVGFSIQNPYSDTVYSYNSGLSSVGQVVYTGVTECAAPVCPKPMTLTTAAVTQTSAQLSWAAGSSEAQWEVCVLPVGQAPPVNGTPVSGTGNYYIANSNSGFSVSGLSPATSYTFYVRAICSSTAQSTWTLGITAPYLPGTFTTKPINDEPANAIVITPSSTWTCNGVTSGNVKGATPTAVPSSTAAYCQSTSSDVWYVFTATSTRHVIELANVAPASSVYYSLFSGSPQSLSLLYCSGTVTSVATNLVVGAQYYIRVYKTSTTGTGVNPTFDLCITTPPAPAGNDECNGATVALVNPAQQCNIVTPGNLTGATPSSATGSCIGNDDDDVWFTFTASSATHTISLADIVGTTAQLNFAVYSGNCDALGTAACSVDNTLTKFDFTPGQQYIIRIWSVSPLSQAVTFNLCITTAASCYNAEPFCGSSPDDPYVFGNQTGLPNNSQVGCLFTIPNPSYYYMRVGETGPLSFQIMQSDNFDSFGNPVGTPRDVDFVAWGPFTSPDACAQIAMTGCPSCPNNTVNAGFYPFGNITDCSYSASATETLSIPNAQAGEYYIVLITNFSNQPGYIKLMQTNYFDANAGHTYCVDKIQLVAFIDTNGNGTKDTGEANTNIGNFNFQKNNTGPVSNVYSPVGTYNVYSAAPSDTFDFSYQVNPEWAPYYSAAATNYNDISIVQGNGAQVYYFPVSVLQAYTDLAVNIVPVTSPRPGLTYTSRVTLQNKGVTSASGTLTFTKDSALSITTLSNTAATIVPGGFTYNFTGMLPSEARSILVTFSVPALPTVALGQLVTNSVGISGTSSDIHPSDNTASMSQVITGSYDPNDKLEAHGHEVNLSSFGTTGYLYYTIRFQNTGNAEAFHVKVKDQLSSDLDPASLRMVSASHNYVLERVGNQLTWDFDNIQLPGATASDELSKGYVTFMIKPLPGYNTGTTINNGAEIYFDTNPAIYTNVFQTLFLGTLSTPSFNEKGLVMYPNPANSRVTVSLDQQGVTLKNILIYDMVGKLVSTSANIQASEITVDVSGLSKGMYVTEIVTSDDFKVVRKLMIK